MGSLTKLPLVDYSDSDSDTPTPPPVKARKTSLASPSSPTTTLPPLPSRFHDLYAVAPRIGSADDPAFHGGRKRSIPHITGNWPTHVFIEWHLTRPEFDLLDTLYSAVAATADTELHSHLKSELGSELPLHLSLSRPNVLATAQREGFLELLEERVEKTRIKPFEVAFTGFEWVCNVEKTRWFFVLKAERGPGGELPRLLQVANRTFEAFAQPALGDGVGGFHVSLAWSLEKPGKAAVEKGLEELMAVGGVGEEVLKRLRMGVETVKVKIGSAVHVVEFKGGKEEEGRGKKRRLSYDH